MMRCGVNAALVVLLLVTSGCQDVSESETDTLSPAHVSYVTQDELAATLADERDVVLVEFSVPSGCSRCDQMRKSIDRLAVNQQGRLTVRRVNLRQHLQLMVELNLSACPSYVAFRNGEVIFRTASPTSADLIESELDHALEGSVAEQLAQTNP